MPHTESVNSMIGYMRYAHGLYNGLVILLFLYQGWLGLKIRQERMSGRPSQVMIARRHRKLGPALVILGIFGFAGGVSMVYLSEGEIFEHPLHFVTGLTLCTLIVTTFLVSGKIRGRESRFRTMHYVIGMMILSLYFIQAYFGIRMLI